MKKIFTIIILLTATYIVNAQHFPKFSQYELNKNLINPAAITDKNMNVNLLSGNQRTGFEDAPATMGVNAFMKYNKMGFGLFVLNDRAGVFNQNIIHLNYTYELKISDDINMQFGLSGGIDIYKIRYNDLNLYHSNDPILSTDAKSAVLPDFNFGVLFSNIDEKTEWAFSSLKRDDPLFYAGISVQHLLGVLTTNEVTKNSSYLSRHFNLIGGFMHPIGDSFQMEETLLLKYVPNASFQADIGFRIFYQNTFWAGLSYRTLNDIVIKTGLAYKFIVFGYSYDISFHKIPNFSSHEIVLGFRLDALNPTPKY